ncbi:MAG: prepilin-type N-terminal cleavage/methylation domain-containing protein [Bacilli bacterium]|nr:prepilin-type N-terminal cleavage/methylation domain-containing protein [Bacilli bacterium]
MKKLNRKGFTLIELLAVIVILAVVLVVTIPSVISSMNKARESQLQNAADTATEWFTKQYELATLGTNAGDVSSVYTAWTSATGKGKNWTTADSELTATELKAAGITDTTGLTGTAKLTNGKVCIKLTAGTSDAGTSPFYVNGGTNTVSGSGC